MKVYLVGGAVRDELLGLDPKDHDYVVVGSTPEEMLNAGYERVGGSFPVFIHPETREEYALARTELKDGNGYQGFSVAFGRDVTIEDDLSRRDLTINAIAKDLETGEYIDPFGGRMDIASGLLTPVSEAFKDDPVRVLRAARFLARYPDFHPSEYLNASVRDVVESGELDHLTPERVWKEMHGALSADVPSRFFRFLNGTGLFPELEAMVGVEENNRWHPEKDVFEHVIMALDHHKIGDLHVDSLPLVRFGALCHDFGKPQAYAATEGKKSTMHEKLGVPLVDEFCKRFKVPNEFTRFGKLCAEYHTHCHILFDMKPKTILKLLRNFRDFNELVNYCCVAIADKKGRGEPACNWIYPQPIYLLNCWSEAFDNFDTKAISSTMEPGPAVGEAIRRARILEISKVDKSLWQKPYDDCHAEYFKSLEK